MLSFSCTAHTSDGGTWLGAPPITNGVSCSAYPYTGYAYRLALSKHNWLSSYLTQAFIQSIYLPVGRGFQTSESDPRTLYH